MARILIAIALAIGITLALDATGYTMFSALPLIPLFAAFAWLDRIPRTELGLRVGRLENYGYAIAHPLLVLGVIAAIAQSAGALDLASFDPGKVVANVAIVAGTTFVMVIITEEGFFRGWLWAALGRRSASALVTLAITTVAFVLWHVSFVYLSGEFEFGTAQIPLFFVNVTLLGLIWGLLRLGSGSILVPSLAHGVWNGLVYVLFGIGGNVGALGIRDVAFYGPEVGLLGVALNTLVAAGLLWLFRADLSNDNHTLATSR